MDRRGFLKTTLVAGTAALAGNDLRPGDTQTRGVCGDTGGYDPLYRLQGVRGCLR